MIAGSPGPFGLVMGYMEVLGGALKDPTEPLPLLLEWQPHKVWPLADTETQSVSESPGAEGWKGWGRLRSWRPDIGLFCAHVRKNVSILTAAGRIQGGGGGGIPSLSEALTCPQSY